MMGEYLRTPVNLIYRNLNALTLIKLSASFGESIELSTQGDVTNFRSSSYVCSSSLIGIIFMYPIVFFVLLHNP